jgi:hypothetical protein
MLGGIAKKPAFFEQLIICWKRYNKIYNYYYSINFSVMSAILRGGLTTDL